MGSINTRMPALGRMAQVAVAQLDAIRIDEQRDARINAIAQLEAVEQSANPFPIIHEHGRNAHSAETHCFALVTGGWIAKLKHAPSAGWQVIITGFRGVQNAHTA